MSVSSVSGASGYNPALLWVLRAERMASSSTQAMSGGTSTTSSSGSTSGSESSSSGSPPITEHCPALDQAMRQAEEARDGVRDALEAPTLDLARLQAALKRTDEAKHGFETVLQGMMLEAVQQMSPAGRRGLVRMMPGGPPPR